MNQNKRPAPGTPFRDAVEKHHFSMRRGENGMPEYTDLGVGSNVLALSQMVRGGDPKSLVDKILADGNANDIADLMVLLFVTRNTRGGKGEKKLAYDIFLRVWVEYPKTAKSMLGLFSHYGYWKDIFLLLAQAKASSAPIFENLLEASLSLTKEQLLKDIAALETYKSKLKVEMDEIELEAIRKAGPKISLLVKWLPREGSSLDKQTGFVNLFARQLYPDQLGKTSWESQAKSKYRKKVAELTAFLKLPEVLLALQREEEIRFDLIASKATMGLRRVFLNEDKTGNARSENPKRIRLTERFTTFVAEKGLKGSQLMPHEIVAKIMKTKISPAMEKVLDAQWKDLWKDVVEQVKEKAAQDGAEFNPTRMVPLADVSGSMYGTPMEVSIALSIGISEITHSAFRGMVLTFESTPRWHRLNPGDSIVQKVRSLESAPWGGSTNFEAAYGLILDVVEKEKLEKEEMPSLIVFSDMQFNSAGECSDTTTMFQKVQQKVAKTAQRLGWTDSNPSPMVFWNLRNTGGHPVEKNTGGAVLLSGFSPALLKLVMHGDALQEQEIEVVDSEGNSTTQKVQVTPEEILRKMLDDRLYDPVREILVVSEEGLLREYEIPLSGALGEFEVVKTGDA